MPQPDIALFLHMPAKFAKKLKQNRNEIPDQLESDEAYLKKAENAYLELASVYKWKTIECVEQNQLKSIEQIGNEVLQAVLEHK